MAAEFVQKPECIQILIDNGAQVNLPNLRKFVRIFQFCSSELIKYNHYH